MKLPTRVANRIAAPIPLILMLATLSGCVLQSAMTLVPGAEEVKFTTNVADITGCPAVGYIPAADMYNVDGRVRPTKRWP